MSESRPHRRSAGPRLRPGLHVVRHDGRHLRVGLDPPWRLVVPDDPAVHALLDDLAVGRPHAATGSPAGSATARAVLRELDRRGMLLPPTPPGSLRQTPVLQTPVLLTGSPHLVTAAAGLLGEAGVPTADDGGVALVLTDGEPARDSVDQHTRAGRPHLLLTAGPDAYQIGPLVVPGRTACLRCVDAHRAESDPRRAIVVEQLIGARLAPEDPVLARLATTWAVRDLLAVLEGSAPATWSATLTLGADLLPQRTVWTRHPHCGCAWADGLADAG